MFNSIITILNSKYKSYVYLCFQFNKHSIAGLLSERHDAGYWGHNLMIIRIMTLTECFFTEFS